MQGNNNNKIPQETEKKIVQTTEIKELENTLTNIV